MSYSWAGCLKCLITRKNVLLSFGGVALLSMGLSQGGAVIGGELAGSTILAEVTSFPPVAVADVKAVRESSEEAIGASEEYQTVDVGTINQWLADYRTGLTLSQKRQLAESLYYESQRYGFQPALVMALIATESSVFNWSRSEQGAVGLMQLSPTTAEAMVREWSASGVRVHWSGEETLFDPVINLRLGLGYLSQLVQQFGDMKTALTAYNYGPTRVSEWLTECRTLPLSYANRVISLSKELRDQTQVEERSLGNQQA
jgi:soluble lytic murein transglycosylase